jgi:hypothetical protein
VKKLNQVIGGGAVALSLMLMVGAMDRAMGMNASQANIMRTRQTMVRNQSMTSMKMSVEDMSSKMKMR